jgi:hypothetical protein
MFRNIPAASRYLTGSRAMRQIVRFTYMSMRRAARFGFTVPVQWSQSIASGPAGQYRRRWRALSNHARDPA